MNDRTPTEATWLLKQGATPEQALERIAQRIAVWRDSDPDEDESWESYYSAAFDMLSAEVDDIISAVSKPIAASPPAPAGAPLTFTYRNWRGEVSERHVRIIGIRFGSSEWHPEPQLLLRAFDLDKGEEREFAMSDIGARAMQDAMAGRVRVKPMDLSNVLNAAFNFGLSGGKWEDFSLDAHPGYRRILSSLEPAGAQEGAYDPERDLEPCLEARLFVTPESLDAFMEANPLPPEPTPAPDVPGLAQRVRDHMQFLAANASGFDLGVWSEICGDVLKAADELEALQAEVERLTRDLKSADEEINDLQSVCAGYENDDAKLEARATAAEAERDALKAEVGRLRGIHNSTENALTLSRGEAKSFLEMACRNWKAVPQITGDDLDDVAQALGRFFVERYCSVATMDEDGKRGP